MKPVLTQIAGKTLRSAGISCFTLVLLANATFAECPCVKHKTPPSQAKLVAARPVIHYRPAPAAPEKCRSNHDVLWLAGFVAVTTVAIVATNRDHETRIVQAAPSCPPPPKDCP